MYKEENDDKCYYLQDELGSPIRLIGGNLYDALGYDEFGKGLKDIGNSIVNTGKKVVEDVKNIDLKSVGRIALNVVAGIGIATNPVYTGYSNYKNGKIFFDGLFTGSLNTSVSVFTATVFGAPLPQNHIGTAGKVILNGVINYVSGLLQGTAGGILGGLLGVNASDQAWSAFAGLAQQLILECIGQEDDTLENIIGEMENSLCIN